MWSRGCAILTYETSDVRWRLSLLSWPPSAVRAERGLDGVPPAHDPLQRRASQYRPGGRVRRKRTRVDETITRPLFRRATAAVVVVEGVHSRALGEVVLTSFSRRVKFRFPFDVRMW